MCIDDVLKSFETLLCNNYITVGDNLCSDFCLQIKSFTYSQLQIEWCGPFVMVKAIKESTTMTLNDYLPMPVFPEVCFRHFGIPPLFMIKKRVYVYLLFLVLAVTVHYKIAVPLIVLHFA